MISEPNLAHVGPHPRSIEIVYYVPDLGQRNKKNLDDRYKEWDTTNLLDGRGSRNMLQLVNL